MPAQASPQSMPAAESLTMPVPAPLTETANAYSIGTKTAVTERSSSMSTKHPRLPEQAPDQASSSKPGAGSAESDTTLPSAKAPAQAEGQSIPAGALLTLPAPVTETARVRSEFRSK